MTNVDVKTSFWRNIISSSIATGVDFIVLIFCTEILGVYYLISVGLGTIAGGVTSFFLGRHWSFKSTEKAIGPQAIKYAISSGLIMICNVVGVYLFTELLGIDYIYSKLIVSIIVGVFVSFGLFRYFVYK